MLFGAGLDKADHAELAQAGARVLAVLHPICTALRPHTADELLLAVAALAHGHAVFLLEGALGPREQTLPDVRRRVAKGARALVQSM